MAPATYPVIWQNIWKTKACRTHAGRRTIYDPADDCVAICRERPNPGQDPFSGHCCAIPCQAVERWHQTLKNHILLENYVLLGDLKTQITAFVGHDNHQRYHESLKNLTPADVYTGRGQTVLLERERTKRKTMKLRRLQHAKSAA